MSFHFFRLKEYPKRWETVLREINTAGTYELTAEELKFGVQTAWRNASRCSARIQWKNLVCKTPTKILPAFETIWRSLIQDLLDRRHDVHTTDEMFGAICDHLKYATNGGTIKPTITVFRQRKPGQHDLRVWQFFTLSYAGYEGAIGDQGNIEFTKVN